MEEEHKQKLVFGGKTRKPTQGYKVVKTKENKRINP